LAENKANVSTHSVLTWISANLCADESVRVLKALPTKGGCAIIQTGPLLDDAPAKTLPELTEELLLPGDENDHAPATLTMSRNVRPEDVSAASRL
jgi:hypothetical protein